MAKWTVGRNTYDEFLSYTFVDGDDDPDAIVAPALPNTWLAYEADDSTRVGSVYGLESVDYEDAGVGAVYTIDRTVLTPTAGASRSVILRAQENYVSVDVTVRCEYAIGVGAAATDTIVPIVQGYSELGAAWDGLNYVATRRLTGTADDTISQAYEMTVNLGPVPKGFAFFVGIASSALDLELDVYETSVQVWPQQLGRD